MERVAVVTMQSCAVGVVEVSAPQVPCDRQRIAGRKFLRLGDAKNRIDFLGSCGSLLAFALFVFMALLKFDSHLLRGILDGFLAVATMLQLAEDTERIVRMFITERIVG